LRFDECICSERALGLALGECRKAKEGGTNRRLRKVAKNEHLGLKSGDFCQKNGKIGLFKAPISNYG
jgi:hypothetical protein